MTINTTNTKPHLQTILLYAIIVMQTIFFLYTIPIAQTALSILRLLVFIFVLVMFVRYHSPNRLSVQVLLYFLVLFACTFIGKGNLITVVSTFINFYTLIILLDYDAQHDLKTCVCRLAIVFSVISYINFICIAIAPEGLFMHTYYLLGGNYNQMGVAMFIATFINLFYTKTWHTGYVNTLLTCITSLASPLIVGSMTSVLGLILLWIFACLKTTRIKRWFIYGLTIVYIIFQTSVVFFGNQIASTRFAKFFVQNILHKSLTFSNRTNVWIYTKNMIAESWIYGYGTHDKAWYLDTSRLTVSHAHNIFLQVLLDGGVVLMVPFLIILIITIVSLLKSNLPTKYDLLFGLLVIFFMMMMEIYSIAMILFILFFIYKIVTYADKV